jgi:hypothetical protein
MIYLIKAFNWLRFGTLTPVVIAVDAGVNSEIEYIGRFGIAYGYFAYGNYNPAQPYRGQPCFMKETSHAYFVGL